jgi:multidrug efflux system membrane fusion protein
MREVCSAACRSRVRSRPSTPPSSRPAFPASCRAWPCAKATWCKAGQVIARIDAAEGQARLRRRSEQADAAKAQIDIAERQYDNNKALVDQGFISRSALDTSQDNLATPRRPPTRPRWPRGPAAQGPGRHRAARADLRRGGAAPGAARRARAHRRASRRDRRPEPARTGGHAERRRLGGTCAWARRRPLQVEGSRQPVLAVVVRINPSAQAGSRSVLAYLAIADTTGRCARACLPRARWPRRASRAGRAAPAVRTDKPAPYVQVVENGKVAHKTVEPACAARAEGDRGWRSRACSRRDS